MHWGVATEIGRRLRGEWTQLSDVNEYQLRAAEGGTLVEARQQYLRLNVPVLYREGVQETVRRGVSPAESVQAVTEPFGPRDGGDCGEEVAPDET